MYNKDIMHAGMISMKASAKLAFFALAAITVTVLAVLAGAGALYSGGEFEEISTIESSEAEILLFEDLSATQVLAYNDGNTKIILLDSGGSRLSEQSFDFHAVSVSFDGDFASFYYEDAEKLAVSRVLCENLNSEEFIFNIRLDALEFFTLHESGKLFFSYRDSPMELHSLSPEGLEDSFRLEAPISFLESRGANVYLYADELFCFEKGDFGKFLSEDFPETPFRFLSANHFITLEGVINRIENERTSPVFRCEIAPSEYIYHAISDTHVAYVSGSGEVSVAEISTGNTRIYQFNDKIMAISAKNAVVSRGSKLYITFYSSFSEVPPESEPGASSDLEDDTFPASLEVEGDYLFVPEKMTVKQLKDEFIKEEISVLSEEDAIVASGYLKTGFRAKGKSIVILGDTNSTGTINGSDIREAQHMLLGTSERGAVQFKAADVNRDGEITTSDLVLLSARIN